MNAHANDKRTVTSSRASRRQSTRRWHPLTLALGAILFMVVLAVGSVAGFLWNIDRSINANLTRIPDAFPEEASRPAPSGGSGESDDGSEEAGNGDGPVNLLLMGSDERMPDTPDAASVSGQRSDVMMLAHIPDERDEVYVVSFPRDAWVDIPGRGQAKINAGLAFGGFPLAIQTVEQLTDARIDHVALISMDGFKDITDTLGGVEVEVSQSFTDRTSGYTFTAGTNFVDGDRALALVRERYNVSGGDFGRISHQQAYLQAMIDKTISRGTLTDIGKLNGLISTATSNMAVDEEFAGGEMRSLALGLRDVRSDDVHFMTAPISGLDRSSDGQSIVVLDEAGMEDLRLALREGTMDEFFAAENDEDLDIDDEELEEWRADLEAEDDELEAEDGDEGEGEA